jgi:hypothetical protein
MLFCQDSLPSNWHFPLARPPDKVAAGSSERKLMFRIQFTIRVKFVLWVIDPPVAVTVMT